MSKSIWRIWFLVSLLMFAWIDVTQALEIVYPADGTYVTKSNYLIIKGGLDPLLSGMSIEINGVVSDVIDLTGAEYRAAFGDMLVVEPIFDPGVNRVTVDGFLGKERMATATATIFYHDQYDASPPPNLNKDVFHYDEREAACKGCHNMNPTSAELAASDARRNPCGSCHARMLTKEHVHGPAGVYECSFCHNLDSRPNKYQATSVDAGLCLDCHDDMASDLSAASFIHGPIEAGMCMVCHDPHASNEKSQVLRPTYELCVGCHEEVAKQPHVSRGTSGTKHPLRGVLNPAGSGEDLSCVSCHEPHAGKSKQMFRWGAESRFELCRRCHNK